MKAIQPAFYKIFVVASLALFSCTKVDNPIEPTPEPFHSKEYPVSLLATAGSATKISYTPNADSSTHAFSWSELDELSIIVPQTPNTNQKFIAQNPQNTSSLNGNLFTWEGEKTLFGVYPYNSNTYTIDESALTLNVAPRELSYDVSLESNLTNTLMVGSSASVSYDAQGSLNLSQLNFSQVMSIFQIDLVDIPEGESVVELYFKANEAVFVSGADIAMADASIVEGTQILSDSITMTVSNQTGSTAQLNLPLLPCDLSGKNIQMIIVCQKDQNKIMYVENFVQGLNFKRNSILTRGQGKFSLLKDSDQIIGGDGLTLSKIAGGFVPEGDQWTIVDYNATSDSFEGLRTLLESLESSGREISITFENLRSIPSGALERRTSAGVSALVAVSAPWATEIQEEAFLNCVALREVNFPLVETLADRAFEYCTSLQSLTLNKATSLGDKALYYCETLTNVTMPMLQSIAGQAFEQCESLESISLPSLEILADNVFNYCDNLKTINFPNLTKIGERAFAYCKALVEFSFEKVIEADDQAFYDCELLERASLPSLTTINKGLFENCEKLHTLELALKDENTKLKSMAEEIFDLPFSKFQQGNITLTLGAANSDLVENNTLTVGIRSYTFKKIIISGSGTQGDESIGASGEDAAGVRW